MDGESILPTLPRVESLVESPAQEQRKPWRSAFLLERGKMTFQRYAKVGPVYTRGRWVRCILEEGGSSVY